jgi:hypothetical protein
MLFGVGWWSVTDVSVQSIGPVLKSLSRESITDHQNTPLNILEEWSPSLPSLLFAHWWGRCKEDCEMTKLIQCLKTLAGCSEWTSAPDGGMWLSLSGNSYQLPSIRTQTGLQRWSEPLGQEKITCFYHHHHDHISVMELGHLLTRSGLTYPEFLLGTKPQSASL